MNAATVTAGGAVRESHALLHVAMELPSPQHPSVEAGIVNLGLALEAYSELDSGSVSGTWAYPELAGDADPDETALRKAAAEVEAAAGDLVQVMAAHCGPEDEAKNAVAGVTA